MAGYVTAVLAFFRAELRAPEASSFHDFFIIITSWHLSAFYSFLTQANFFETCLVRSTIANPCPNYLE